MRCQHRLVGALGFAALTVWAPLAATAQEPGDVAAFLLGLRDQRVFAAAEAEIPLNGAWNVLAATRLGPGRYKAAHKDGVLRIEAEATSPRACVLEARFTIRTAGLIANSEVWTLDLAKARLSVERKTSGPNKGVGLRVAGKDAFCFTSTLRADACTDSQLFDDHTPNAGEADLERKAAQLQAEIDRLRSAGCGG